MAKLVSLRVRKHASAANRPRRDSRGTDRRLRRRDGHGPDQGGEQQRTGELDGDQVIGVERLAQRGDMRLGPALEIVELHRRPHARLRRQRPVPASPGPPDRAKPLLGSLKSLARGQRRASAGGLIRNSAYSRAQKSRKLLRVGAARRPCRAVVVGPALHLRQHDHEQKGHDDCAGVDDDRARREELRRPGGTGLTSRAPPRRTRKRYGSGRGL